LLVFEDVEPPLVVVVTAEKITKMQNIHNDTYDAHPRLLGPFFRQKTQRYKSRKKNEIKNIGTSAAIGDLPFGSTFLELYTFQGKMASRLCRLSPIQQ
jgi:hypothetical protein